jgi:hypothetical protein
MEKKKWLVIGAVFLLTLFSMTVALSAESPNTGEISKVIDSWFVTSGLSDNFRVKKVRLVSRRESTSARWLALEVQFVTASTNQDEEDRRFQYSIKEYRGIAGLTFPEKLFYKFVHVSGVPRTDAVVYLNVLENVYEILYDRKQKQIVFRESEGRFIRKSIALDKIIQPFPNRKAEVPISTGLAAWDVAPRVQNFLRDYFLSKNREAGLPPPQFILRPVETDYAAVDVQGIRKQVIVQGNYWEKLQISIELKDGPQGRQAVGVIDGYYAPGLGLRVPTSYTDMESEYHTQLEAFTDSLLHDLQRSLAAGGR